MVNSEIIDVFFGMFINEMQRIQLYIMTIVYLLIESDSLKQYTLEIFVLI